MLGDCHLDDLLQHGTGPGRVDGHADPLGDKANKECEVIVVGRLGHGPMEGEMAESGERGRGRMAEPLEIAARVEDMLSGPKPLAGMRAIVTSGPTHEPIDPVRYIANRSSGKQGHAIAAAAAAAAPHKATTDKLIQLLLKKGLLTAEEARTLLQP